MTNVCNLFFFIFSINLQQLNKIQQSVCKLRGINLCKASAATTGKRLKCDSTQPLVHLTVDALLWICSHKKSTKSPQPSIFRKFCQSIAKLKYIYVQPKTGRTESVKPPKVSCCTSVTHSCRISYTVTQSKMKMQDTDF